MSNSSKMIFVAGAVLVSVVIIALSLFVFSNAQGRVNDSMKTMSSSEVEGFNSTYISYQGKQNGSQVKAMINRILANVNTYEEIPEQIPCVSYNTAMNSSEKDPNKNLDGVSVGVKYSKQTAMYLSYLNFLSKGLEAKHTYYIVMTYSDSGIISGITINYDENNSQIENFQAKSSGFHGITSVTSKEYEDIIGVDGGEEDNIKFSKK